MHIRVSTVVIYSRAHVLEHDTTHAQGETINLVFNLSICLYISLAMASYLITGASRGIGLATARTLASKPASEVSVIFAAARTQTDDLKRLVAQSPGRVHHVSMDVENKSSIQPAVATVESVLLGKGLDVLINNAGIMPSTRDGIENMLVVILPICNDCVIDAQ